MAERAAMYRTLRTDVLPPAIIRWPRQAPESRLKGATPTRAASFRRSRPPSSGNSAIRGRAVTGPTPGTRREQVCRFAPSWRGANVRLHVGLDGGKFLFEESEVAIDRLGEPFACGVAATVGLHADHLDNLAPSGDEFAQRPGVELATGRTCGLILSANRA